MIVRRENGRLDTVDRNRRNAPISGHEAHNSALGGAYGRDDVALIVTLRARQLDIRISPARTQTEQTKSPDGDG